MKRAFVVLALCLVLALIALTAWAVPVSQSKEQVVVTAQTLAGDPSAAEGLIARQGAIYENQLMWDMTIPASQPEKTVTDFTCYLYDSDKIPQALELFGGIQLYTMTSFDMGLGDAGVPMDEELAFFTSSDRGVNEMKPLFRSVCAHATPGESYTETVRPTDFLTYYPLSIDVHLPLVDSWLYSTSGGWSSGWEMDDFQAFYAAFQDFFAIPIPEEARWEVTVCTTENGNLQELGVNSLEPNGHLNTVSAVGEQTCYWAFLPMSELLIAPDLSQVPGGPGIYAVDYGANQIDTDSLRNFFPLSAEESVRSLTLSPDGETLSVITSQDGSCTCTLIDPATAAERQRLCLSENIDPGQAVFSQLWGDDCLFLYSETDFVLYEKQADGSYAFAMAGELPSPLFYAYTPVCAWDGARLAIGTVEYDRTAALSFTLAVYQAGQLTYRGQYESSLNDLSDPAQAQTEAETTLQTLNYFLPQISLSQANPLSLTWQ